MFLKGGNMVSLYLFIGYVSGILFCSILNKLRVAGYLRIDKTSDPDTDHYLIEISKDLEKISKRKSIVLKIDSKFKKPQ